MPAERGPSGTGHNTAGWVGLQRPTRVAHAPEPDPAADPVVSPADTPEATAQKLAEHREHAEWVRDYLKPADMDGISAHSLNGRLLVVLDLAAALLAVGERDRQQIARLTEAANEVLADAELMAEGTLYHCATEPMYALHRAVLADEEDAGA